MGTGAVGARTAVSGRHGQAQCERGRNPGPVRRRDVEQGLAVTLEHFTTRPLQQRALDVLQFKLDILWAMNDAMAQKYGVS